MANFKDFLAGFTQSLARQRKDSALMKSEDEQWERRQRLLSDLNVEERGRMNALEKKDGNTIKQNGEWVTEVLDGGGNVTGYRPASPAEIAAIESDTLDLKKKQFDVDTMDDQERRAQESHSVDMDYKRGSLGLQARRLALEEKQMAALEAEAAAGGSVEGEVSKWLDSTQGKLAAKAYMGTLERAVSTNPNLGGRPANVLRESTSDDEKLYVAQERLRESIMQHLAAIPPEQRPKNNVELQALITRLAGASSTSLDRYAKPLE